MLGIFSLVLEELDILVGSWKLIYHIEEHHPLPIYRVYSCNKDTIWCTYITLGCHPDDFSLGTPCGLNCLVVQHAHSLGTLGMYVCYCVWYFVRPLFL